MSMVCYPISWSGKFSYGAKIGGSKDQSPCSIGSLRRPVSQKNLEFGRPGSFARDFRFPQHSTPSSSEFYETLKAACQYQHTMVCLHDFLTVPNAGV
jgi:hypothetical protein